MLSDVQIEQFRTDGFLVVEDVLDQASVLDPVREEYAGVLDGLIAFWQADGLLGDLPKNLDFNGKLLAAYKAGLDWFQPMDIFLSYRVIL